MKNSFLVRLITQARRSPSGALLIPVGYLALFFIIPLLGVVAVSLLPDGHFGASKYGELIASGAFFDSVWVTAKIAAVTAVLCLLLGYPYAYVMCKVKAGMRLLLMALVIAPFLTSILIRSYAWVALLSGRGPVNAVLKSLGLIDTPLQLVFNDIGVLIGCVQIQLPLMIMTLYGAMSRIDPDLWRAADSLGAHRIVSLIRVYLPLSLPGIAAGLSLTFTSTLGFYVTPVLLGNPTSYMVTQSIYVSLNSLNDMSGAASKAVVLLAITLVFLNILGRFLMVGQTSVSSAGSGGASGIGRLFEGRLETLVRAMGPVADAVRHVLRLLVMVDVVLVVVILTVTMAAVIPLGFSNDSFLRLPPTSYSTRWISEYLSSDDWMSSTYFSLWLSGASALLATFLGALAAYGLAQSESRHRRRMELFFITPMVVPPFVIVLALYVIFIKIGLLGSSLSYILTYAVFTFPYVFLVMYAAFQRFEFSLVQAASIFGARSATVWRTIVVPLMLPTFISGFAFAFLLAFDDVVVGLFFGSGGRYTLPMRMWADIRTEISPRVAAVAVLALGVILFAWLAYWVVSLLWRKPWRLNLQE